MAIGTTAAILGLVGAGLSAGSSVASAKIGSSAAKDAAKTIATGQDEVAALTKEAVEQGQDKINLANTGLQQAGDEIAALYNPFTEGAGDTVSSLKDIASATGPLSEQFSFKGSDLIDDPGYQETLKRGQEAIARSAAAQGGLFGTNTLKRLGDWTQGTANTFFNDAFSRAKTTFDTNRAGALSRADTLKSLASLALSGTQGQAGTKGQIARDINDNILTSAQLGIRGAENVGAARAGAAQATAAGKVASTNSWLDALKQGTNGIQEFLAKRNFTGTNPSMWEDVTYQGT